MSIELKGLIAAVIVAVIVLGVVFGISAFMAHRTDPTGKSAFVPMSTRMSDGKKAMDAKMAADKSSMDMQMASASLAVMQAQLVRGKQIFSGNCASCHGADAKGGFGPTLHNLGITDTQIASTIKLGRIGPRGKMPAFSGKLSDTDIQALVAYLDSLKK